MQSLGLGNFIDDIVGSVTADAVTSATAAAQPLIAEIEVKVKAALLPVVIFSAGSFLLTLLTYREVRRRSKPLSGARR